MWDHIHIFRERERERETRHFDGVGMQGSCPLLVGKVCSCEAIVFIVKWSVRARTRALCCWFVSCHILVDLDWVKAGDEYGGVATRSNTEHVQKVLTVS